MQTEFPQNPFDCFADAEDPEDDGVTNGSMLFDARCTPALRGAVKPASDRKRSID